MINKIAEKYDYVINPVTIIAIKGSFAGIGLLLSMTNFQKIRWLSYISNFFSLCASVVLIVQMPFFIYNASESLDIKYWDFNWKVFPVFGAAFFSFTNQFSMVSIIKEQKNDPAHYSLSVA